MADREALRRDLALVREHEDLAQYGCNGREDELYRPFEESALRLRDELERLWGIEDAARQHLTWGGSVNAHALRQALGPEE